MAISKKESRKITVNGVEYLYKVSKIKKKSEWRKQENELNEIFMKQASYYGLGKVRDVTLNVIIQLKENPVSNFYIKIKTILVDGFMGAEQITQIKPKFISELVEKGLDDGWNPSIKGDYRIEMLETETKDKSPIVLQLPNMNEDIGEYANIEKPREIQLKSKMNKFQSYFYVGPKEIIERVDKRYEGTKITQIKDILKWVEDFNQTTVDEKLIATFVISENEELLISDRHSEHVMCAGGRNVLSAGEITYSFEKKEIYVSEISNQSTGYCPKPDSWEIVEIVLSKIGLEFPKYFTRAFEFRYCENCETKNLIKEGIYECAVCGFELDLEWNFSEMKDEKNKK